MVTISGWELDKLSFKRSTASWHQPACPRRECCSWPLVFHNDPDSRENICGYLAFCPWEAGERCSYLFRFLRTKIIGSRKY